MYYAGVNDVFVLCLCENSPRFHQNASNQMQKVKFSQESMPPDLPSLSHTKYVDITSAPTFPLYLILPPLGQKPERNPAVT